MQISAEAFIAVVAPIGTAFILGLLWVNDHIIRHVCRREGKHYSIFWIFDMHWRHRSFRLSWFKEAKEAGYIGSLMVLTALWIMIVLAAIVLHSGGFVSSNPPLITR
jgi:hypothetical protein